MMSEVNINSTSIKCAAAKVHKRAEEAMSYHGLLSSFFSVTAFIFTGFAYYFYYYAYFS